MCWHWDGGCLTTLVIEQLLPWNHVSEFHIRRHKTLTPSLCGMSVIPSRMERFLLRPCRALCARSGSTVAWGGREGVTHGLLWIQFTKQTCACVCVSRGRAARVLTSGLRPAARSYCRSAASFRLACLQYKKKRRGEMWPVNANNTVLTQITNHNSIHSLLPS